MAFEIDDRDKVILEELIRDAEKSKAKIAKRLEMTRQGIFYKIKRMKEEGIIRRQTLDVDEKKIGLGLRAFILVKTRARGDEEKQLEEELRKKYEVDGMHLLFGDYELLLEILVRDREELSQFVDDLQEFDDAVIRTKTLIVYNTLKSDHLDPIRKILKERED